MNDRRTMTDEQLERALGDLGNAVAWPTTRDLSVTVMARITSAPIPARSWRARLAGLARWTTGERPPVRRSLVLAVLVLLAAVAIVSAVALGVPGIRIFFGPVATPGTTATPALGSPAPTARGSGQAGASPSAPSSAGVDDPALGRLVSLDEARSTAGFHVLLPGAAGFETPDAVHLLGAPPVARVSLTYGDRASLTEFVGSADPDGFQKIVGHGTTVEPLTIGGQGAFWITGAPHELMIFYRDGAGGSVWESTIVTGNVLIWQDGEVTLRLVTALGEADAISFAQSMR